MSMEYQIKLDFFSYRLLTTSSPGHKQTLGLDLLWVCRASNFCITDLNKKYNITLLGHIVFSSEAW